tara:strand:- start:171 stop:449 length:279 start_codon:yes stop_codon:yes gene_type:complete
MKLTINIDVIKSFNKAIRNEFNNRPGFGSTDFWNFVESDMYMDLREIYGSAYIDACFDFLADAADEMFDLDSFDWDGKAIYKMGLVKEGVAA